ncbi:hypothetical protein [Haladaptatus sp. GCM10025893]|uniref:hypothetical protein n=1 Tax=Haladaptatus sp. GCM10025893 TaxID=3252659 RepID=UPI0036082DBA
MARQPGDGRDPHDATILSPAQIADLYELDEEHLGIDRSALLSSLLSGIGVSGIGVYDQPGELAAYAILRPGKVHPQVGPVVAPDADSFSALLNQVTSILADPRIIIDTLPEATIRSRLDAHGLAPIREFSRMTYESDQSLLADGDVRAVAGVEWG